MTDILRSGPPVLVTGVAGFIGHHMSQRLLDEGVAVVGVDNLNAYYDVALKRARLARLATAPGFHFIEADIAKPDRMLEIFDAHRPLHVVHLAAQAGVRYSLENPFAYADSNLTGFLSILEACRRHVPQHLLYASSSSVYGGNRKLPFSTSDNVDQPVSLYAATKKANELMAHTYSHLYGIPATGLRFFTVYGRWGRPDMAYWKFTEAIMDGRPIDVYNHGDMARDFTHVDEIVESMARLLVLPPDARSAAETDTTNSAESAAPHRIFNIGASKPEKLLDMIGYLEEAIGRRAEMRFLPMQPGDVPATFADMDPLRRLVGSPPSIPLRDGLRDFASWFRQWREGR